MQFTAIRVFRQAFVLGILLLAACGGGGGGGPLKFSIGGTISGLNGTVVLQNNGSDDLVLSASGDSVAFTFSTRLANKKAYRVTVLTQPAGQICTVANAAGTVAGANVTTVQVNCISVYTLGGTITGQTDTVILQNNGGDTLTLSAADNSFVFDTPLPNGAAYQVSVLIHPAGQRCQVTRGADTIAGADVTNVLVECNPIPTYTIGGSITGLTGTVVLQNNGGDDLPRTLNGAFTFGTAVPSGSGYSVSVLAQPAGQTCSVTGGSGVVSSANISGVQVNCITNPVPTYTIGGTVSGLNGTVVLQNNGADNLARNTNGSFTFATGLTDGAAYDIRVFTQPAGQTCTVAAGSDTVAGANVTSAVVTCENNIKRWQTAGPVELEDSGSALFPQVVVHAITGNALVAWSQSDGLRENIMANPYTPGVGWGTAVLIESDNLGNANAVQLAMDANGNVLAVWSQSDGTRYNIWANRYSAATASWGTAVMIEIDDFGNAGRPQVAFDASGNAIALWEQSDGARNNIWANRYTDGGGWGSAALIEDNDDGEASYPQFAFDASGNAIAVWQHSDGTHYNIRAARYTAATSSWGTSEILETMDSGQATTPQIAIDANGNALVVWQQQVTASRYDIWANRYMAGTNSWGTAELIETQDSGHALAPQIAMDPNGNAIAVWYQFDGARTNIVANRYTAGIGWGTAELIETDNLGDASHPQVATDWDGNAAVVWHQSDGIRTNIWANRYTAATSQWGSAERIESDDAGNASYPQIAFDANGNAIAVWQQSDGNRYNIQANRYE